MVQVVRTPTFEQIVPQIANFDQIRESPRAKYKHGICGIKGGICGFVGLRPKSHFFRLIVEIRLFCLIFAPYK